MVPTVAADYATQIIDLLTLARDGILQVQRNIDEKGMSASIGQFNNALLIRHLNATHLRVTNILNVLVDAGVFETDEVTKTPPDEEALDG